MNPKVSEVKSGPSKRKLISNSGDKFYSLSSREYMCQNQLDVKEKGWDVNQVILLATILNLELKMIWRELLLCSRNLPKS